MNGRGFLIWFASMQLFSAALITDLGITPGKHPQALLSLSLIFAFAAVMLPGD